MESSGESEDSTNVYVTGAHHRYAEVPLGHVDAICGTHLDNATRMSYIIQIILHRRMQSAKIDVSM